jgi:hypothetical protein
LEWVGGFFLGKKKKKIPVSRKNFKVEVERGKLGPTSASESDAWRQRRKQDRLLAFPP